MLSRKEFLVVLAVAFFLRMAHRKSVADALEEYAGKHHLRWDGKQLVGLYGCYAPVQCEGFHYRVDGVLPGVAASDFIPEIGMHHISLALVQHGTELKPFLSFSMLFL